MVVLFDHFWGQLHWETDSNCSFSTGFNASLILHGIQDGSRRGIKEVPLSSYLLKIFRSFWTQNNHTFISFFSFFIPCQALYKTFCYYWVFGVKFGHDVMNWVNVRYWKREHLFPVKIKKKMVCWEFNCFSYSCKSLIIFLLLCSCFTAFTWPSYPRESITCDIMKQFESVAKWSLKKKQKLPFAYGPCNPWGCPAITPTIPVIVPLTNILECIVVGREHKKLHFRWGHGFSSSPLKGFLKCGVEFFKGNSPRPRSGPWPYVVEWRQAQCRSVLGSVPWG